MMIMRIKRCLSLRMAKHAWEWNEEMASAFIASTSQLIPRSSLVHSDHMHYLVPSIRTVPTEYTIMCGSAAEFCIRPLIVCINNLDFLCAHTNELAFSEEFPVLPSDLSGLADTIKCYKIEPYDRYPGFVRLREWGEMNYNWKYKNYEYNYAAHTNRYICLNLLDAASRNSSGTLERIARPSTCRPMAMPELCGPAIKRLIYHHTDDDTLEVDFVRSVWCPQWPTEAKGWPNRPRNSGWPTTDTISEVLQTGCYFVYIQHLSCRKDKLQWRFSFSLAELILVQSWTQTQQIIYLLLKFFAKRELIQNDCPKEDEVVCTYHLKTLMLWTCEEMSPEWWNSSSVIAICCELLKLLAE